MSITYCLSMTFMVLLLVSVYLCENVEFCPVGGACDVHYESKEESQHQPSFSSEPNEDSLYGGGNDNAANTHAAESQHIFTDYSLDDEESLEFASGLDEDFTADQFLPFSDLEDVSSIVDSEDSESSSSEKTDL